MKTEIAVGLSFFPEPSWITAALPLIESGEVQCLEHTIESQIPSRFPNGVLNLLQEYSKAGRLLGHSMDYPLLAASNTEKAELRFQKLLSSFEKLDLKYALLSAHFGFIQSERFQEGAPLPMPLVDDVAKILAQQLKRFSELHGKIGIENLALTCSADEAAATGPFLAKIMKRQKNSFLLLDLHNLYCASVNFRIPFLDLLRKWPLDKVEEIHLSGGSFSHEHHSLGAFRRDTHDGAVPEELFQNLALALPLLPNLRFVILEQLASALRTDEEQKQYRKDFLRIKEIVHGQS